MTNKYGLADFIAMPPEDNNLLWFSVMFCFATIVAFAVSVGVAQLGITRLDKKTKGSYNGYNSVYAQVAQQDRATGFYPAG